MSALAQLACIVSLSITCASPLPAPAATTIAVPDKRDGQVLDTVLLQLLADPRFEMTRAPTNGAKIVLHTRTPEKTGFLPPHQMRSDLGGHTLPGDAQRDLRRRNSPANAKPDTYDAIEGSYTTLTLQSRFPFVLWICFLLTTCTSVVGLDIQAGSPCER